MGVATRVWAALIMLVGLADSVIAQEQDDLPAPVGDERRGRMGFGGTYVTLGPTLAAVMDRAEGNGVALGGELSLVNVSEPWWLGAYLDATHAFSSEETRFSIGPELGLAIFGLDAGYMLKVGGPLGTQHGFAFRFLLTVGFASAYLRSAWLAGEHADWFGEAGLMVKLPMPIDNVRWF